MSETVQSIISFLSSRASNTPLTANQLTSLTTELRNKINQLSVTVPNAASDAITVLYSGWMPDGTTHTGAIAAQLAEANPGKVLTINQTKVYELLDSNEINNALKGALGNDIGTYNNLINGSVDSNGTRIPDSLWDDASRRFAQNAVGEVRVLAPLADGSRVFAQTELPALMNNANVTNIDGIPKTQLQAILNAGGSMDNVFKSIKSTALDRIHFTELAGKNYSTYLSATVDDLTQIKANKPALIKSFLENIDQLKNTNPAQYADFVNGLNVSQNAGKALAASGLAKGLNKLGVVGGLLGFMVAANEASAKSRDGDDDGAKEIMKIWAIDNAGSEIASIAAGAIASVGLVQNLQQAMMKHESGRLVEWVAQFVQADQAVLKALPYASIPSGLNPTRLQSHASSTASHYYRRVLRPPYNFGLSRSVKPTLLAKLPVLNGRLAPHRQTRLTEDLGDGFLTKKACRDYRPAADRQPRDMSAIL